MKMPSILLFLLSVSFAAYADTANVCAQGAFETDEKTIQERSIELVNPPVHSEQNSNTKIPVEISRIRNGAISEFVGASINEGMMTWYAFDADRQLFVAVLARSNRAYPPSSPNPDRMSPNQILRYSDAAGYKRSEFVTALEATPAQVRNFSCLANQVLITESENEIRPMPTDTASRWFALLSNGKYMKLPNGKSLGSYKTS